MMMEQADIHVEVRGQEVIVRLPGLGFEAVYYKPSGMAEMALRRPLLTFGDWFGCSDAWVGD